MNVIGTPLLLLLAPLLTAVGCTAAWEWWSGTVHLVAVNAPDPEHLVKVKESMCHLGPPVLRAVAAAEGSWLLVEGSHRTAAACAMGLPVVLVPLDPDEPLCGLGGWDRDGEPMQDGMPAYRYTPDLSHTSATAYTLPARRVSVRRWWWPRPVPAWL